MIMQFKEDEQISKKELEIMIDLLNEGIYFLSVSSYEDDYNMSYIDFNFSIKNDDN